MNQPAVQVTETVCSPFQPEGRPAGTAGAESLPSGMGAGEAVAFRTALRHALQTEVTRAWRQRGVTVTDWGAAFIPVGIEPDSPAGHQIQAARPRVWREAIQRIHPQPVLRAAGLTRLAHPPEQ